MISREKRPPNNLMPISIIRQILDDVALRDDTIEELHSRLMLILNRLVSYGLLLNASKCQLFIKSRVFLGFLVSEYGIAADSEKVAAIRERPLLRTTSEIRDFVSAAGYLRCLIKNLSEIAGTLIDQSVGQKNQPVILTKESIISYNKIKEALTTAPLIKKFNWKLPIIIESDASQKCVGVVLLQPHLHYTNGNRSFLHPIA